MAPQGSGGIGKLKDTVTCVFKGEAAFGPARAGGDRITCCGVVSREDLGKERARRAREEPSVGCVLSWQLAGTFVCPGNSS